MMQLTDGVTTITLPDDMEWEDEFTWSNVVQDVGYTLTGAMVVETATRQAGMPITLKSPANQAVINRATLKTLKGWANTRGKVLSLTLRGESINVMFRHGDGALGADVLGFWCDSTLPDSALYFVTLRFMEI
jgi:hypothetical protein